MISTAMILKLYSHTTISIIIDIPTRDRTLDKCYGNIIKAYKAHAKSGLGSSDHDVVHLVPKIERGETAGQTG